VQGARCQFHAGHHTIGRPTMPRRDRPRNLGSEDAQKQERQEAKKACPSASSRRKESLFHMECKVTAGDGSGGGESSMRDDVVGEISLNLKRGRCRGPEPT
jgi:hypothetical protein